MDALAAVAERVAGHSSRLKKIELLAAYLRELTDEDLPRAVRFLSGRPFAPSDPRRLAVGHVSLREAAIAASGWDPETVRLAMREVGDVGEAISLLMKGRTEEQPLSLAEAEALYAELFRKRRASEKTELLRQCLTRYCPPALKYFLKVITGDLRIGLQERMLEEAIALAAGLSAGEVHQASSRSGDLTKVALAARRGRLEEMTARLFRPLDFMLARSVAAVEEIPAPEEWLIEDKYDGIRAQAHLDGGRVVLYTRGLSEATGAFPELEAALERVPGSALLDGEVVAWREGRILPFRALQQRLTRKAVPLFLPLEVPAAFVAYDLLFRNGVELLGRPLEERRARLEEMLGGFGPPLLLAPQSSAGTAEELERLFEAARARGHEGLVLKRRGSLYEAGRRGGAWLKWKRPLATLDVVITAAEQGQGRRAGVLSDYTFAVRSPDGFLNVGKAHSGLTDEEIRELTGVLRALALGRYGPALRVRPAVVLEVAFDGIQKSSRHAGGYALRFPRIVRWRRDKTPREADDLERVRWLYENLTGSARRPRQE